MSILRQSLRSQLAGPSRSNVSFLIRPLIASVAPFHTSTPARSLQNIFETPERPSLAITKFNDKGYHLTDGLVIPGGVVFVGGQVMLWDVDPPIGNGSGKGGLEAAWKGWGKERFKVFESVSPRPEILLFGTGNTVLPAPREIRDYISSLGIQLDVMDSRNAASTYNLLVEEGRTIGAALCPLKPVDPRTGGTR